MLIIIIPPSSAATSHIAICNNNYSEVTSFNTNQKDECLKIYAKLYINGEWKGCRDLDFDVYDPTGNQLLHFESLTSSLNGYKGMGIWSNKLSEWLPGNYTVKVSYAGNEAKGWPATTSTAVIHHSK